MQVSAIKNVSFGQTLEAQKGEQEPKANETHPWKAALSYVIPGAGNIANGNVRMGFAYFGTSIATSLGLVALLRSASKNNETYRNWVTKHTAGLKEQFKNRPIVTTLKQLPKAILPAGMQNQILKLFTTGSAKVKALVLPLAALATSNNIYSAYKAYKGE